MNDGNSKCQNCGGRLLPIIYGLPSPAIFRAAQKGEVILGGCGPNDNGPNWKCEACEKTVSEERWQLNRYWNTLLKALDTRDENAIRGALEEYIEAGGSRKMVLEEVARRELAKPLHA